VYLEMAKLMRMSEQIVVSEEAGKQVAAAKRFLSVQL